MCAEDVPMRRSANRAGFGPINAEERSRRTTRALRVSKTCNKILVRADTEYALLNEICGVLIDEGGFQLAWVGLVEHDVQRTVRPAAYVGFEKGYLEGSSITWADTDEGRGPVGKAIRSGRVSVCQRVLTDSDYTPWREEAVEHGYRSMIALPLKSEVVVFGILSIYANEADAFDSEEEELLSEMADDLAYGLMAIRGRIARRLAEEALQQEQRLLGSLLKAMPDHIYFKDRQSRFVRINDAMARRFGVRDPSELVGKTDFDVFSEEHARQAYDDEQRIMDTGQPLVGVEEKETWADGRITWVSTTKVPLRDKDGNIVGMVGVSRDITGHKCAEEKLLLFRSLIERSNDAIEVIDPATGRYLDANECAFRSLGYSRDELLALTVFDVEQNLDRAAVGDLGVVAKRQGITRWEGVHRRKDGTTFPVEVSLALVALDRDYIVTIVRDITERKRTEEAMLLQSTALDAAANAIFITDRAGSIQSANRAFVELTGYTLAEAIGRNPGDLVKSNKHDAVFYRDLWETILAGKVWNGEIVNQRKDGSTYTEEMTITPVRATGAEITHFIAIKQDVTERKAALEKIRRQAALLDQANDAIYVRGIDGTISYWSEGAVRLYGWSRDEAMRRRLDEMNLADFDATAGVAESLLKAGGWTGERQQETKAGEKLTVFIRLTVVEEDPGQRGSIFAIVTDITERKRIEARFLQAQRLESIGALAGGIAHDLNNVLAPIVLGAPLVREALNRDEARSMFDLMTTSAQRGADIVKQVLTFARGNTSHRVPLQVRHLLRDVVKMAEETFPKNVRIKSDTELGLWLIDGDATQVHQAIMNLCINARDAMPAGGTLSLQAENVTIDEPTAAQTPGGRPGPYIRLRVTDTGMGIPAELRDRLFEPFFTTKEPGKGTGLGLSTVLGIAHSHGGFVRVESEVGQGATFELMLPAVPGAQTPAERSSAPPITRSSGELILLVDDEAAVREAARQTLEQFGYRIAVCSTGVEALDTFRAMASDVRLVVTDMMMPEMDGHGLVKALRTLDPTIPLIGITGVTDAHAVGRLMELGLFSLIAKPFSVNELLNAIRQALGRPDNAKTSSD